MASQASAPSSIWTEYTLPLPTEHVAPGWAFALSDIWEGIPDVAAVTILYGHADIPETEEPEAIRALSTNEQLETVLVSSLKASEIWPDGVPVTLEISKLAEADWAEAWKQFWGVDKITERLTICPSWEEYTPKSQDERVLHLDPGMAFGTGAHQTTRLMLEGIERVEAAEFTPQRVLDCGTGSGILAIYSATLGMQPVDALDISENAIIATQANAVRNLVGDVIIASTQPLAEYPPEPTWDLLLVNILAPIIEALLPDLTRRALPGATLLASGIVAHQQAHMVQVFKQQGWRFESSHSQDHWVCLTFKKP